MKISVIIPALNEHPVVGRAIGSAFDAGADEVILCDGGSSDRTPQLAFQLGASVVESRSGRGKQMAAGADFACGEILVFLHADNSLSQDCLTQIRNMGSSVSDCTWGCFQHRINADGRSFRWLERGNNWRARVRGVVYGDQTLWLHRDAYHRVGGFPDITLMEDVRISDRLKRLGRPLVLPGPVWISDRHWRCKGVLRTTLRNQLLLGLYRCGWSPDRLARIYRK